MIFVSVVLWENSKGLKRFHTFVFIKVMFYKNYFYLLIVVFVVLSGLHTANLSWQTRVGKPKLVCVNGTKTGGKHVCKLLASNRNVFADCFYAIHTHTNLSLPT